MKVILWHRRDLRIIDNLALLEASKIGTVIPVFVLDKVFFESNVYCKSRLFFLKESLVDLQNQYRKLGTKLVIMEGDPLEVLKKFSTGESAKVYFNQDTNGIYGIQRDKQAEALGFVSFCNDAIQRQGRTKDWSEQATIYFNSPIWHVDSLEPHGLKDQANLIDFFAKYNINHDKQTNQKGGTTEGQILIGKFLKKLKTYPKNISSPLLAETGTSRLSTHFSFGTVSTKMAYQAVQKSPFKQKHFYTSRLFWNQHFTQKLAINPNLPKQSVNPVFLNNYDLMYDYNPDLIEAWKQGSTGYPLVDASMRALNATGFLNFRMRAMVASFFSFILRQPWEIGADYMFSQLIDADVAINYSQWQMQTGQVGIHPNRIYNPTKQILEFDPEALFIRKYVVELEKADLSDILEDPENRQTGLFNFDYIKPVVSYKQNLQKARDLYASLNKEAFKLIKSDQQLKAKIGLEQVGEDRLKRNQLPDTKEV